MFNPILKTLKKYKQDHLLRFWDKLDAIQRKRLLFQLNAIDWTLLDGLINDYVLNKPETAVLGDISPAPYLPVQPRNREQELLYKKAVARGAELLKEGTIAVLTVAGGQGTRLGFDGPKGTFPITPVKGKTLFQYFAESIIRAGKKYGFPLQWYIMTSTDNDIPTRDFFRKNNYFNLEPNHVHFFSQGTMPAIGMDGRVLLSSPDSLALAPDGHGGTLLALRNSGALDEMKARGIKSISYFQVDNPLVSAVDPLFIGMHDMEESEMSCRMLIKTGPYEKLGNFCIVDGRLQIIEYSDMPQELAEKREKDGSLFFKAGSPAIHVISRSFIERLTKNGKFCLPWHRAEKKVPFIDANGNLVKPQKPNAVKLEMFIFDAIPMAGRTMILEAKREDEFSPVKNPEGVDSIVSCRAMLVDRDSRWLEKAGMRIPRKERGEPDCVVELSPLSFLDDDDVIAHIERLKWPNSGEEVYYE